jgi:hypothetical protein
VDGLWGRASDGPLLQDSGTASRHVCIGKADSSAASMPAFLSARANPFGRTKVLWDLSRLLIDRRNLAEQDYSSNSFGSNPASPHIRNTILFDKLLGKRGS